MVSLEVHHLRSDLFPAQMLLVTQHNDPPLVLEIQTARGLDFRDQDHGMTALKNARERGGGGFSHQQALDDGVPVLAFIVHHFNVIQVGISPVHQPADQIQRDAVGENYLTVHQLCSVLAIHVAALHLRDLTVVCEEHLPVETKDHT